MCYALSSDKRCLGPKYPVSEGNFVDYGRGGSPCWKRTKTSRAEDGKPGAWRQNKSAIASVVET